MINIHLSSEQCVNDLGSYIIIQRSIFKGCESDSGVRDGDHYDEGGDGAQGSREGHRRVHYGEN